MRICEPSAFTAASRVTTYKSDPEASMPCKLHSNRLSLAQVHQLKSNLPGSDDITGLAAPGRSRGATMATEKSPLPAM